MRLLVKTLAAFVVFSLPVAASATAVIGGNTRLAFGSVITGLEAGLTGNASLVGGAPGLTVNFDITGGDLDAALAGTIRHDGSGITLSNGTNVLGLGNFVIDTVSSSVLGDVSLNGADLGTALTLFVFELSSVTIPQLTDLDNPQLGLRITSITSNALDTAFGTGDLVGLPIGQAATAPQLATAGVPEPDAWAMLILGLGGVGSVMRLRQRRGVVAA